MVLKNVMWNIFQDTGRIDAYLFYRNCDEENKEHEFSPQINLEQVSEKYEH